MNQRPVLRSVLPMLTGALFLLAPALVRADRNLAEYAQPALRDVAAEVKVLWKSDRELSKIGKGYSEAYSLSEQFIWCKEPNHVRVQGKKGILTVRFVTDGSRRMTEVSPLHIHRVENVQREPSKANNISDLGLITPEWTQRVRAQWVASEVRNGRRVEVFNYEYPQDPELHHTIAVDPTSHTIAEHITHFRNGNPSAYKRKVVYSDVREINGVSVPTTAAIYNGEGKLAAQMRYDGIRVNTGLQDSLFRF